ncbi:hypothetical protein RhiirA1_477528 [Rhizophagus irregularis]|uniref:Uncharacterized protein n=1 Tax=Rhizophagus irregularis TaxID=588596 RepID=A0A2N0QTD4_9GLOM|nr:hypothetical protein RhiirA1_477528 [Rhizophagus irregularis]
MSVPSSQSTVLPASSPLIITSASNLTSDEKQNLLFDVDRALEIPMEVLTKSGGPSSNVVQVERHKNSPNYTHSLSEIDRLKRPKAIRSLVEIEAAKNYSAPTITSAVKEYATLELGLDEPARELKRKEVANIKYKVRGPAETYLIGNPNLKLDISDSISYLTEQGYHIEKYCISQRSIRDSTHKTNRYDWRLFTLYVRITYGCWNVDAHFFVSSEDADTVTEALIIIRNKYCHWSPRYILSDHSNIEAKSIKKTFPGMAAGEQETKIGCESLVQDTINSCPVPSIQITSTNSLEFFHSELKKTTSSSHGLISAAHKVVNVESASFDFRIKKISAYGVDVDILEKIQKFPFPFQQLIIREACAVMNRLEKGKSTPGLTSLDCFCLFCHQYLLPYKHIFHEHMYGNKLLTTNVWQMFCKIFEESGFKVYESRESFIEYV